MSDWLVRAVDEESEAVIDLEHTCHFEEVERLQSSLCSSPFCFQSIHAQSVKNMQLRGRKERTDPK